MKEQFLLMRLFSTQIVEYALCQHNCWGILLKMSTFGISLVPRFEERAWE